MDDREHNSIKRLESRLIEVISDELNNNKDIAEGKRVAVALTTLGILVVKLAFRTGVDKNMLLAIISETWDLLGEDDDDDDDDELHEDSGDDGDAYDTGQRPTVH